MNQKYELIPQIINPDGTLKHIFKEGARYHVEWWDTNGTHCSETNCELNKR